MARPAPVTVDYRSSCRLCLSDAGRKLPIFGPSSDGTEPLNVRILACVSVEVSEYDELPQQICHRCECQVSLWYYFREECKSSQLKLSNWHRSQSTSSILRSMLEEDNHFAQEVVRIKCEPEDSEFHAEMIDNVRNDGDSICGEAINPDHGFEEQPCQSDTHLERPSSSWNLVISETSSISADINAEENAIREADSVAHANNISGIRKSLPVDNLNGKEAECGASDFRFNPFSSPGRSYVHANMEDSNDAASNLSTHDDQTGSPEFVSLNISSSNSSIGAIDSLTASDDPLNGVKEETDVPQEELLKVKKEQKETAEHSSLHDDDLSLNYPEENVELRPSSPASSHLSPPMSLSPHQLKKKNISKTSSNFSSTSVSKSNEKTYISTSENDQVYNYAAVDLPKISNDLFDENMKYCKLCKKSYHALWRHMKDKHMKENPFKCEVCGKVFSGRREYVTHRVRTISKYCRAGHEPDVDESSIICHENMSRGKIGRYECSECKEKFGQLNAVRSHVRTHTGEKPFFCYKCNDKEFIHKKSALKHVSVCNGKPHTSAFDPKAKVKIVSGSSKVPSSLKPKIVMPVLSSAVKRKCTKCGKLFSNGSGFSNHLRVECVRKCFACSKFVVKKLYHKHYRQCFKGLHHPFDTRNGESLSSTSLNSKTGKSVSPDLDNSSEAAKKTQDCKEENKVDTRKNAPVTKIVDMHLNKLWEMHLDKDGKLSSLTCQLCQRTSCNRKGLRAHLLKHSAKAFRCAKCRLRISSQARYEAHMAKFHEGIKSFTGEELSSEVNSAPLSGSLKTSLQTAFKRLPVFKAPKLKCDICLKLFSSATSLKYHKQSHKRVRCQRCEISFPATMEKTHICIPKVKLVEPTEQLQTNSHVTTESSETKGIQYTCHLCKKKFHTRKMLYQHKKMHIKMKIYKCKICGNSYSNAEALLQHKTSSHPNEVLSNINADDSVGNDEDASPSRTFLNEVEKDKVWQCTVCHKSYSRKDSLSKHMKLHKTRPRPSEPARKVVAIQKPNQPNILFCNICDKAFGSRTSFYRHKGRHTHPISDILSKKPPISNDSCLEDSSVATLSKKTTECNICHKMFSTQQTLKRHLLNHNKGPPQVVVKKELVSSEIETQYKCKICSKTFSELALLSNHITSHLGNSQDTSSSPSDLPAVPVKTELLQCKLCNKEYRCRKSLKYHMMVHSGEKPYKCRSCSNQYSNPNALAKHEKERHPVILRPFSCHRCKTSFILKEDLLAHHEKCTH